MVETGWENDLSGGAAIADLRRCRGQQRESTPLVEAQPAAPGGSDPAPDHRLSLPARYQQVEQDRAPTLFVYQSELEGQPLINYETIINLIGGTKTRTG